MLQFGLISDVIRVQFTLASGLPDGALQPMTVRVGTRVSAPYTLNVVPPPPATCNLRNETNIPFQEIVLRKPLGPLPHDLLEIQIARFPLELVTR